MIAAQERFHNEQGGVPLRALHGYNQGATSILHLAAFSGICTTAVWWFATSRATAKRQVRHRYEQNA